MYGTLMRCRTLPGKRGEFEALARQTHDEAAGIAGYLGSFVLYPDDSADEVAVLILFESEASYRANAASPQQHQRYLAQRALMAADPSWTDGRIEEWQPATVPI